MGNFNEIRKNAYEMGILLDGCGTDERYYNFGYFVDLCGAEPKELMPKCCCCDNDSGGTGELINNMISLDIINDGNAWTIHIESENPVASNIIVTIDYSYTTDDGIAESKNEAFTLPNNSSNVNGFLTVPSNTNKIEINSIKLSPYQDNTYNYIINYSTEYKLYYGTMPIGKTMSISSNDIKNMQSIILSDDNVDISFNIPAIGIEGIDDIEDEEEVENILKENAYDLIIAYDARINNYEIIDLFGDNDEKFVYNKDLSIDNKNYKVIVRSDPDTQRNVYDTNSGPIPFAPITYSFNIK